MLARLLFFHLVVTYLARVRWGKDRSLRGVRPVRERLKGLMVEVKGKNKCGWIKVIKAGDVEQKTTARILLWRMWKSFQGRNTRP
jgi:hypothetical protein